MFRTTLGELICPKKKKGGALCASPLSLETKDDHSMEVVSGLLRCGKCQSRFPILAGVAILVDDVRSYIVEHVKGIAQVVSDSDIPREYRSDYLQAKADIRVEHIEWDLEARRVTSLYVMNHYLSAAKPANWWQPESGTGSALIESLIVEYWDQGPLARVSEWILDLNPKIGAIVELGCGVGGLYPRIRSQSVRYIGVDSSFSSIAIARHLALGVPMRFDLTGPRDLLQGSVSQKLKVPTPRAADGNADFIVGDVDTAPVATGHWDCAVALNMIDMLDNPAALPKLQRSLVKKDGTVIQSSPYVWHEAVAKKLRKTLPKTVKDSASAVAWLYESHGLKIEKSIENAPWLFFKHLRQLEIYSAHLFLAIADRD